MGGRQHTLKKENTRRIRWKKKVSTSEYEEREGCHRSREQLLTVRIVAAQHVHDIFGPMGDKSRTVHVRSELNTSDGGEATN
jgi:hypothetical protein